MLRPPYAIKLSKILYFFRVYGEKIPSGKEPQWKRAPCDKGTQRLGENGTVFLDAGGAEALHGWSAVTERYTIF